MAKTSPTQRTLALLRKEGWTPWIVEKWIAQARKRIDLFGIIDILAIKSGTILGVQATTDDHAADHITKALAEPNLIKWLDANGLFELWTWSKKGPRGKRKTWKVRKQMIWLDRLNGVPVVYKIVEDEE